MLFFYLRIRPVFEIGTSVIMPAPNMIPLQTFEFTHPKKMKYKKNEMFSR